MHVGSHQIYFFLTTGKWLNSRSLFTQQQMGTQWQHWGDKGGEERNWPSYLTCRWLSISVLSNWHSLTYESIRDYLFLQENTEAEISLTPQRRKSFKVSATMAAYKTEWVAVKTIEGNHVDLRRETLLELRQVCIAVHKVISTTVKKIAVWIKVLLLLADLCLFKSNISFVYYESELVFLKWDFWPPLL